MVSIGDNWVQIVRDLEHGDQRALLKLSSFVASRLRRMRATDFRDDWSDLVQEVIIDVVMTLRKGGGTNSSKIAGLIITGVNIIGGLFIGVFQFDMQLSSALGTYTTLTVGDGLVAQIPALIISMAAGIAVTKASSDSALSSD